MKRDHRFVTMWEPTNVASVSVLQTSSVGSVNALQRIYHLVAILKLVADQTTQPQPFATTVEIVIAENASAIPATTPRSGCTETTANATTSAATDTTENFARDLIMENVFVENVNVTQSGMWRVTQLVSAGPAQRHASLPMVNTSTNCAPVMEHVNVENANVRRLKRVSTVANIVKIAQLVQENVKSSRHGSNVKSLALEN